MKSLRQVIEEAKKQGIAIGHFNFSDLAGLYAIVEAAKEISKYRNIEIPVILGTSEGERDFVGAAQAVALVRSVREKFNLPIFLNADHTHSMGKIKEAVAAGYDAVLFDGSQLPWEENVKETRAVVEYVKSVNSEISVEGEIGYIGSASEVLTEVPKGAALAPEELTTPEQAKEFIERTGVDFLAPAVGNIHGIVVQEGFVERLDAERIKAIAEKVGAPLVLHGASGLSRDDLRAAVQAGVRIIHVNTELRVAWRTGIEASLRAHPDEVAPYKIFGPSVAEVKKIVREKLELFTKD